MGFGDIFRGFLGTEKKESEVAQDPFGRVREPFLDFLTERIGKPGETFTGQMVAPMSQPEAQSFDFLRKFGEGTQAADPTFQKARKVVGQTLEGQFDPTTSPYYQAVKAEAARNLASTQENIKSEAAGRGNVFTGGRIREQARAATDVGIGLNKILGELAMRERQNQLSVIPQALGISQTLAQEPLQRAEAFQLFGALPREIEQAMNTAAYNEWLRSQVEVPMQIANLASGFAQAPIYQQATPSIGAGIGRFFRSNYDAAQEAARKAAAAGAGA